MGFTWTDDENDPANLYKGNLLFEVAMRYGLVENVDNWSFGPDEDSGLLNLWHASANLTFNDCGGLDLAAEYKAIHGTSISDRITGDCAATGESFLAKQGYVTQDP